MKKRCIYFLDPKKTFFKAYQNIAANKKEEIFYIESGDVDEGLIEKNKQSTHCFILSFDVTQKQEFIKKNKMELDIGFFIFLCSNSDEKNNIIDEIKYLGLSSDDYSICKEEALKSALEEHVLRLETKENFVSSLSTIRQKMKENRKTATKAKRQRLYSEEMFEIAVEASPNGLLVVDNNGHIQLINQMVAEMFGYQEHELLDKPVEVLIPERFRPKHPQYRESFFSHPEARKMGAGRDLWGLRKDGTEFAIEIGLNPIQTEHGLFVLSSIIDISDRKELEQIIAQTIRAEAETEVTKQKSQELQKAYDFSHSIINTMLDTLLFLTPEGSIQQVNPALLNLLNYQEPELLGKPVGFILAEEEEEEEEEEEASPFKHTRLKRLLKEGFIKDLELSFKSKRGDQIPMSFSGAVMRDKEDKIVGIVGIARDIRPFKEVISKLENLSKMKSEFISLTSHELRTPLTIMRALVDNLKTGIMAKDSHRAYTILENNMKRMTQTIEDTLCVAKIEKGSIDYHFKEVDLKQFFSQVSLQYKDRLKEKGLSFETTCSKGLPAIEMDEDKMMRVFTNIIDNAIKFTDKGLIKLSASRLDNDKIEIFINDTGCGIEQKEYEHIFQKFRQIDPMSHGGGGVGLGLFVVKEFISGHGGQCFIESRVEQGTTFYIILPIKQRHKSVAKKAA